MAVNRRAKSSLPPGYEAYLQRRESQDPAISAVWGAEFGLSGIPGGLRGIGNPLDPRLAAGGVYQVANIPGLPPPVQGTGALNTASGFVQTGLPFEIADSGVPRESNVFDWIEEDLARGLRSGRSATARALQGPNLGNAAAGRANSGAIQAEIGLFPAFKADTGRTGGAQLVGGSPAVAQTMRNLAQAAESEAARRTGLWWGAKNAGIEPVTRGDAEVVGLRDSQMRTERFGEDGRWAPTSDRDANLLEQAVARVQGVRPGSADSPRRGNAPIRRKPGKVRAEEIDQIIAELEAQGITDPRQDPRFLEMEEAARFVRSIPQREGYEGDPALIDGPSASGKSWGGINPYGPLGLTVSDAQGRVATRAPGVPQLLNVYPGETTGQIRTLDKDATALWDREEDPTLGRLVQEARNEARTPVITGVGLNELTRLGRYRQATATEMQALAPERENAPNTLKGFVVQAGSRPMAASQLIEALSKPENAARLQINRNGQLVSLDPASAAAGFNRILSVALDPANPEFTITPSGRFARESADRLPELYLEKPDGTISRLALAVSTEGNPSLLVREWAPVYESDAETKLERAKRNSLGQPIVVPEITKLYRVGRPTNQNNAAIKETLRDLLPGFRTETPLNPRSGVRPLLQGQQRGDFVVMVRDRQGSRVLSPEETEAALVGLVQQAVDPAVANVVVDPATNRIAGGAPQFMIQRPDGSILPMPVSVRPGPNPEPLVQLPGVTREVGPTFLNTGVRTRMEGAKLDPDQDLYPILRDLTEAAFSEGAPVASTQQVTRELMAGLMRGGKNRDGSIRQPMSAIEAANVVAKVIAERSSSPTVRGDYGNALRNAVIEFTGGESRLGSEVPAPAAKYTGLAEILDFARGLNQREGVTRVVPAGDVRELLRTRVRLAGESDDGSLDVAAELSDPVRQALQDEMAARELAGYGRGRSVDDALDDLESDAYLAEGIGRGVDEGLPGESPRLSADVAGDAPTLQDLVAASAYNRFGESSLVGKRSMSERGPIENELKRQAQLLAEAAVRAGGTTSRPAMVEQVVNTPQGPQRKLARAEQRSTGLTPQMLRALAGRMAEPPVRSGSMQEWVNYGTGWNEL